MIKDTFGALFIVAISAAAIFGISYFGLQMAGYFQPKYEEVRRKAFEGSRAFNEGMIRDFDSLRMEYVKTDEAGKAVIRSTALHRFAAYDPDKLPSDLRSFYFQLKAGN